MHHAQVLSLAARRSSMQEEDGDDDVIGSSSRADTSFPLGWYHAPRLFFLTARTHNYVAHMICSP